MCDACNSSFGPVSKLKVSILVHVVLFPAFESQEILAESPRVIQKRSKIIENVEFFFPDGYFSRDPWWPLVGGLRNLVVFQ